MQAPNWKAWFGRVGACMCCVSVTHSPTSAESNSDLKCSLLYCRGIPTCFRSSVHLTEVFNWGAWKEGTKSRPSQNGRNYHPFILAVTSPQTSVCKKGHWVCKVEITLMVRKHLLHHGFYKRPVVLMSYVPIYNSDNQTRKIWYYNCR